jgi:hypothetical protein
MLASEIGQPGAVAANADDDGTRLKIPIPSWRMAWIAASSSIH